jgi:hypothetical protein
MAGQPLYSGQFSRQVRDMIALGAVKDWSVVHKFGHNSDLGSSIEDVWAAGGVYSYLTAATLLEVVSDDANDTAAGSGARTVTVEGLDANFHEITETVSLDGITAVPTTKSFIRFNRAFVATTGTYGTGSAGDITVRVVSAGATQGIIQETTFDSIAWDYGQTQIARYTVPAGKFAFLSHVHIGCESNKRADFALFQRRNADTVAAPFSARRVVETFDGVSGEIEFTFDAPLVFPAKTDIFMMARLSNGSNGRVTTSFEVFVGDL